ncbi:hypothetical protein KPH14_001626 [Odynerus spinipes]|uniref:Uncharacterized protein n=1 Tax=Odynerus spinipes TaxID=1348599 RepID=A0AAD9VVU8_9HYME|nr:hypothetical protein KPH14_001626 [Odynerus spinipes]
MGSFSRAAAFSRIFYHRYVFTIETVKRLTYSDFSSPSKTESFGNDGGNEEKEEHEEKIYILRWDGYRTEQGRR